MLQEFSERWEVDKYLSASGYLPPSVKPFFVALPKDRQGGSSGISSNATSAEWRRAIQEVDGSVKQHLRSGIEGGFDEERFGTRIGFGNLRRWGWGRGEHGRSAACLPDGLADSPLFTQVFLATTLLAGFWRKSWRGGTATLHPPRWRCCRIAASWWHAS